MACFPRRAAQQRQVRGLGQVPAVAGDLRLPARQPAVGAERPERRPHARAARRVHVHEKDGRVVPEVPAAARVALDDVRRVEPVLRARRDAHRLAYELVDAVDELRKRGAVLYLTAPREADQTAQEVPFGTRGLVRNVGQQPRPGRHVKNVRPLREPRADAGAALPPRFGRAARARLAAPGALAAVALARPRAVRVRVARQRAAVPRGRVAEHDAVQETPIRAVRHRRDAPGAHHGLAQGRAEDQVVGPVDHEDLPFLGHRELGRVEVVLDPGDRPGAEAREERPRELEGVVRRPPVGVDR